jgi:hypothetical protein
VRRIASPTWRLAVVVDDAGLGQLADAHPRFRVAWADREVVASPSTIRASSMALARERLVPASSAGAI